MLAYARYSGNSQGRSPLAATLFFIMMYLCIHHDVCQNENNMLRTQITLDEEQHRFLKKRAYETGVSLSALIRQAINEFRAREAATEKKALDLLGAFEADRDDVAEKHDQYFTGRPG
jgi:hypothetical protein